MDTFIIMNSDTMNSDTIIMNSDTIIMNSVIIMNSHVTSYGYHCGQYFVYGDLSCSSVTTTCCGYMALIIINCAKWIIP